MRPETLQRGDHVSIRRLEAGDEAAFIRAVRASRNLHRPWSYLPEVTDSYKFKKDIKIHDFTLRDGEQQTAVVFRREEKVAIAKKLDALGIHRIEAGMPAVSEQDKAAISDIAALALT